MSEKKSEKTKSTENKDKRKLDDEVPGITLDSVEPATKPDANEEEIVADPEGARRHGQTPAA